jgi:hypothetical protein
MNGLITPEYEVKMYMELFLPNDCLILASEDNNKILEILQYRFYNSIGDKTFDQKTKKSLIDKGLGDYLLETIAYIKFMESFQRLSDKKIGRNLINQLKSIPKLNAINIISFKDSQKFYEKVGFDTVGYTDNGNPIMAWKKY